MTVSQTAVVIPTVMSMVWAKPMGSSIEMPTTVFRKTEVTKAAAMAATSLHALMRHQYQRRISTVPVPAPVTMSHCQAPWMESRCRVTKAETMVSPMVAIRDAHR